MTLDIFDSTGRFIAPPQTVIAERVMGPWDSNARADGSWAGPVKCSWCGDTLRAGVASLPVSHTICATCLEQETA